jgi:hypothetical protein
VERRDLEPGSRVTGFAGPPAASPGGEDAQRRRGVSQFEEHEVRQQRTNRLQRLLAVDRLRGPVALARQARLQDLAVVRVVVDDQDERRIAHQPVRSSQSTTLASKARGLNGLVT